MLNNITMGQYYPVDSKVHRLDPRVKLILTIVFIVTVFMARTFLGYAVILGFVWLTSRLANVPFRMLLRGLKPLRLIIILTFLLNLFFTTGETVWVEFWGIRITQEGFMQAAFYSLRLIFLVIGTSLLTLTTSPVALSDGIEILLSAAQILRAETCFPVRKPWSPCWCRCLSVPSAVREIWLWPWKAVVIMAVKAAPACVF